MEANYQRAHFDKATGDVLVVDLTDKPDTDLFEEVDAGSGEQFMAVKPWIGAVKEPQNRKFILN